MNYNYAAAVADVFAFETYLQRRRVLDALMRLPMPRGFITTHDGSPEREMTAEEVARATQPDPPPPAPINLSLAITPGVAMLNKPECSEPDAQGERAVTFNFTILPTPEGH